MIRKSLSKKIRFEVFKRDKFTCQYCGGTAPTVLLHVDHIEPVAKGGQNEIANLITSCFDCNLGKSDRKLTDGSTVEKQRKQLELIQERREQIELMFEWKKSLSKLDDEIVSMITDYIESKISPYTVSEGGRLTIKNLLKKYDAEKILSSIDIAYRQYIKISTNGDVTNESAEIFFEKIGGILHIQNLDPIKQKLAYIKGIAKNRFHYFDSQRASIILNNYIKALSVHGYNEAAIIKDLEEELMPRTKELNNWTEWTNLLDGWMRSIEKWSVEEKEEEREEYDLDRLKMYADFSIMEIESKEKVFNYIAKYDPNFNEGEFRLILYTELLNTLNHFSRCDETEYKKYKNEETEVNFISEIVSSENFQNFFTYEETLDYSLFTEAYTIIERLLKEIFHEVYFPTTNLNKKEALYIMNNMSEYFENELVKLNK